MADDAYTSASLAGGKDSIPPIRRERVYQVHQLA